jgi:hypothetical protein
MFGRNLDEEEGRQIDKKEDGMEALEGEATFEARNW